MKIALAQIEVSHIPDDNLATARHLAAEASQYGTKILIFPEMFMARPGKTTPPSVMAEPLDGAFVSSLSKVAQQHGLHIVACIWEKIPNEDRVYNTAILLSPQGETLTVYRKLHLFDALSIQESDTMLAGNKLPTIIQIGQFNIGLAICYDLRFPELFRQLALQGADLIIAPSAWYAGPLKEDHWLILLRARAIENTCYVAGVNQTGSAFCGRSAVFDPFGVPVADAGEGTKLLFAELDRDRIAEVRSKLPALNHIRSDRFGTS